jgi:hypothetical protein
MGELPQEDVLVVPRSLFERVGAFQGFCGDTASYLAALLDPAHTSWRPRATVEDDPSLKQLIPYCVLSWRDATGTPHYFAYTRGGGQSEARLRAKRSVGIGGHISSIDGEYGDDTSYDAGMRRELAEEIAIDGTWGACISGSCTCWNSRSRGWRPGRANWWTAASPRSRPCSPTVIGLRPGRRSPSTRFAMVNSAEDMAELQRTIYLDNHSTTRLDPRVLEAMLPWLTDRYGNAGSVTHDMGREAREAVEAARGTFADAIAADPRDGRAACAARGAGRISRARRDGGDRAPRRARPRGTPRTRGNQGDPAPGRAAARRRRRAGANQARRS